jgi:hypothetical protein
MRLPVDDDRAAWQLEVDADRVELRVHAPAILRDLDGHPAMLDGFGVAFEARDAPPQKRGLGLGQLGVSERDPEWHHTVRPPELRNDAEGGVMKP